MPKTIIVADPTSAGTVGLVLTVVRVAAGNAGVEVRLDVPGEPGGTYVTTLAAMTGTDRTNIAAFYDAVVALFKTARGY